MPHFSNATLEIFLYSAAALAVLLVGYRLGRLFGALRASKEIARKEDELFTAQKGFKQLYEQELTNLKQQNAQLGEQVKTLNTRVEEYRKKAAGFGGLFSSGNKHADAMYALLLENEALEEALYAQNEKLRQERTDAVKEQLRSTGYRRVLMSQLLNDERIKGYVAEIMAEQSSKHLPSPDGGGGHERATSSATSAEG
jgi:cell division protein FtsB